MAKTRNRLISVGIALLALIAAALFVIPQKTASAETWIEAAATGFANGDGSQDNPYQISSGAELAYLAKQVSGGNSYENNYFKLTADIDLGGKEWNPIGYGSYDRNDSDVSCHEFKGTFDGNNRTISGLKISDKRHVGLFWTNNGTIKNLYLDNVEISTYQGAGAICDNNKGTIENCGVLSGKLIYLGSSGGQVGGICESNSGKISKCYNMADIVGGGFNGGICNKNDSGATIENCYNGGKVAAAYGTNSGICQNNSGTISCCLNFGEISSESGSAYGICSTNTGNITNCYNDKSVNGEIIACGDGFTGIGSTTNVNRKTTAEICGGITKLTGFSDEVWGAGSFDENVTKKNGRLGAQTYTYPKLTAVTKTAATRDIEVYNFSTDNTENYDNFTYIETAEDFQNIDKNLKGNYVLKNDIELDENYKPIGSGTNGISANEFTGKFSGNGRKVYGFNIIDESTSSAKLGLFRINSGTIMNLTVEGNVNGSYSYVGGICGVNNSGGVIVDCSYVGSVYGISGNVGGICGENKGTIERCAADGTVYSNSSSVGGICGKIDGGTIKNCFNSCDVTGSSDVGGIIGGTGTNNSTVEYCISVGKVRKVNDNNNNYVGGISGNYDSRVTISNCYFDSDVSAGLKAVYYAFENKDSETVKGLATAKLCDNLPEGFNNTIWAKGSIVEEETEGRFGTRTATYISLKDVGEAKSAGESTPIYNFGVDDNKTNWREFTYIETAEQYKEIFKISGNLSGNYVLGADIDFGGAEITPIGDGNNLFTGNFSGDGHIVSNFKINKSKNDNVGLFGRINGTIMNLGIENAEIRGYNNVGGVCGNNIGTIANCYNTGNVGGANYVGGVCGYNSGTIKNCYNTGAVSSQNEVNVGGVCGYNKSGTITNCYYNKDICEGGGIGGSDVSGSATGLSTNLMTDSDALSTMKLDSSIWVKKQNVKGANGGTAYYPSFSEENAPSVKYTAELGFTIDEENSELVYGGEIKFNGSLTIKFGDVSNNFVTKDAFSIKMGEDVVVEGSEFEVDDDKLTFSAKYTAKTAGKKTFTLVYSNKNCAYIDGELKKDLMVDIKKKTFDSNDFTFAQPTNNTYDGKVKEAKVTTALEGVGDIKVKYFDSNEKLVESPINAGTYTVKIDVSEGEGYNAAKDLGSWSFTIGQKTKNISDIDVTYGWEKTGVCTVPVEGIPEDLGTSLAPLFAYEDSKNIINQNSVKFSGGKLTFSFNKLSDANIGDTAKITTTITSQNYADITFTVNVTLNGLKDPTVPKCELTIVHGENGVLTATITAVEGAEYKFNNGDWLETNSHAGIEHGAKVTASIRMKAVDGVSNASETTVAVKYATDGCKFTSDANGHTLTCTKCSYAGENEPHTFSGNACAVCGYKKSGSSGGSSGGGSHSGGSSGGGSYSPTNPAVDGKEMSWSDVKNEISKLGEGAEATLDLNGNTTIPKDVIKAIAEKNAVVTIKVNGTFSWTIDGSKLTESDIKEINFEVSVITATGTETLRGTVGTGFKIDSITEKATLNISFRAAQSGKFANLYKKDGEKLTFIDNVKIDENGSASGLEVHEKGEYAVMLGEFSDRQGDMNNDGVMNAKDALAVLKHSAKLEAGKNLAVADVNGDGIINAKDALIILKKAAGLM